MSRRRDKSDYTNAHRVNAGYMPNLDVPRNDQSDFYFVEARDPEDGVAKIPEIVKNRLPKRFGFDPIKDIQVLCPMNRGGLGARALNVELQKALNPPVARQRLLSANDSAPMAVRTRECTGAA